MKFELVVLVCLCVWQSHAEELAKSNRVWGDPLKQLWKLSNIFISVYAPDSTSTRIVGGTDAKVGGAPYQCSMQLRKSHFCGCSIVSDKWAVTAAHCVIGQKPGDLEIVVGTNDLKKGGTRYNVTALYHHSRYNNPSYANDIALIRINGTIKFTTLVQPIDYSPKEVQPNATLQLSKVMLCLLLSRSLYSFHSILSTSQLVGVDFRPEALYPMSCKTLHCFQSATKNANPFTEHFHMSTLGTFVRLLKKAKEHVM